MAVPKKKKSYMKSSKHYNVWKSKKIIYNNFTLCSECLFIKRIGFGCSNCFAYK